MSGSTDVVFKGDGEPKEAGEMIRRLSEFHEDVGLELDDFSRGGTVEKLERRMAGMLGKEAAVFMPGFTAASNPGPWCRSRATCTTTPGTVLPA